jgi:cytidine deaminase
LFFFTCSSLQASPSHLWRDAYVLRLDQAKNNGVFIYKLYSDRVVAGMTLQHLSLHSTGSKLNLQMENKALYIHQNAQELSEEDRMLLVEARRSQGMAYAPYSGFRVGAALRTENGLVVMGANQENGSYPLCMCGERVALYNYAMHCGGDVIATLAIVASGEKSGTAPAPPCGACLQVLNEFEMRQNMRPIRLLLQGDSDIIWEVPSVKTLLPYSFDGSFLKA